MHILDTDTLTHLYAGHPRIIDRLKNIEDPDICTTIITKIELLTVPQLLLEIYAIFNRYPI